MTVKKKILVVIEKSNTGFSAFAKSYPVYTTGSTMNELINNTIEACAFYFENEKFDTIVSLFALLHFPNPLNALKETYRVIKPGGTIVIGVGSGIPLFSLTGLVQLAKKLPSILQNKSGKQLVAPHFLDSLVKNNIAEFLPSN